MQLDFLVAENVTLAFSGFKKILNPWWLNRRGKIIGGCVEVDRWLQNFCSLLCPVANDDVLLLSAFRYFDSSACVEKRKHSTPSPFNLTPSKSQKPHQHRIPLLIQLKQSLSLSKNPTLKLNSNSQMLPRPLHLTIFVKLQNLDTSLQTFNLLCMTLNVYFR